MSNLWYFNGIIYGGVLMFHIQRVKNMFFNIEFIKFIAIGVINSFNGIWIAYVYSLFITNAVVAYICGFFTSLSISYLLNSIFNFKQKITISKFLKFAVNNIPNFIIQILSVVLFLHILETSKLIAYTISAVIAVPITFMLVKINVFKK